MRPATLIFFDRVHEHTPLFGLKCVLDAERMRVQVCRRRTLLRLLKHGFLLIVAGVALASVPAAVIIYQGPKWLNIATLICPGAGFIAWLAYALLCIERYWKSLSLMFHRKVWLESTPDGSCTIIGGHPVSFKATRMLLLRDSARGQKGVHFEESFVDVLLEDRELNYALLWILEQRHVSNFERDNFAALQEWAKHVEIQCVDASHIPHHESITKAFEQTRAAR